MDQLENASRVGNLDGLYQVIRQNPSILVQFEQIPFVNTPLHIAAYEGHIKFSAEIMRLMPSFAKKQNQDGLSPMHLALQREHTQLVSCLICLDPELVRDKGRECITPLHYVVHKGNVHLLSKFLSVCPESIEDLTIREETALHIAVKSNNFEIFKVLIDSLPSSFQDRGKMKRILNWKDLDGNNLLHIISSQKQHQALDLLLECNNSNPGVLELNALNNNNMTALDIACNLGNNEFQTSLRVAGVKKASNLNTSSPTINLQPLKFMGDHLRELYEFDFAKSIPNDMRSDLLVVAVLMATATFQAGLSPPGGLGDNNVAVLSSDLFSYASFMLLNSAAFILSLWVIMVLIAHFPWFLSMWFSVFAMVVTYVCAVSSISPPGYMRKLLVPGCCLILMLTIPTIRLIQIFFKHIRSRSRNAQYG